MRYLAVLKDSVREAIDSKVLYVMVGVSCLVMLFIASLGFAPQPAEDLMTRIVEGRFDDFVAMLGPMHGEGKRSRRDKKDSGPFHLHGIRVLKGQRDSPESEYALTVRMSYATAQEAGQTRKQPEAAQARLRERFTFVEMLQVLQVASIRPLSDFVAEKQEEPEKQVYFEVVTHPTPATRRVWFHEPSLFFGAVPLDLKMPLGALLFLLTSMVLSVGSWVAVLVSVILTAFFIPNMLRKGTVDLLLVKPIRRWTLLLYKYLGGLIFIFFNTAIALGGIWLVLGLRSGVWAHGFLLMILVITFYFAVLYAVSTLFAVLTRSVIVAILMTCGAWFLFFLIGLLQQLLIAEKIDNTFSSVVRAIYTVTPRTRDMNTLGQQLVLNEFLTGTIFREVPMPDQGHMSWRESVTVSGAFVAIMLTLACWWFSTKDY